MSIINPIYLYVKTHNKTGLKYFGKTTRKDPHKYPGSGKHWISHLEKHGYDYKTEIYGIYSDREECLKSAIEFSEKYNIVESKEWANLRVESLDGGDTSKTQGYKNSLHKIAENGRKSKWWNNGTHQTFSEFPPNDSYIRGRLKFNNVGAKLGTEIQKGKIWINNGTEEKMIYPSDPIPNDFVPGRLKLKAFAGGAGRHSAKGTKWWNDGLKEIMSITSPGPSFVQGRIKKDSICC
jgi:hypothetical protein